MICDKLLSAELVSLEAHLFDAIQWNPTRLGQLEKTLKSVGKKVASRAKAFTTSTLKNLDKEAACFSRFFFLVTPPTTWCSRLCAERIVCSICGSPKRMAS